ncbi:MAG: helix-turn-helix transcriptional regulator [Clostridia bacterium]|nr:helix-turn-helix transcriptional regulator [Clostridia bacterium]
MSRLGDMIRQERVKAKMTPKQLAKKSGVSEKYIIEVEAGTRIINDEAATRILKIMGSKTELFENMEARETPHEVQPGVRSTRFASRTAPAPKAPQGPVSDAWKEALSGNVRGLPVLDGKGKTVSRRMVALTDGKIFGSNPEKVFYFQTQDSDMHGYHIRKGDYVLLLPASQPVHGKIMLMKSGDSLILRKVNVQDGNKVLLHWYDLFEAHAQVADSKSLVFMGRAARIESDIL